MFKFVGSQIGPHIVGEKERIWPFLMRLVLVIARRVGLHTIHQNIKSLCRSLNWIQSLIQSRWSLQHLTLSRLHLGNQLPLWEHWAKHTFQGQQRGWGGSIHLDPAHGSASCHIFSLTSSNRTAHSTWAFSKWVYAPLIAGCFIRCFTALIHWYIAFSSLKLPPCGECQNPMFSWSAEPVGQMVLYFHWAIVFEL